VICCDHMTFVHVMKTGGTWVRHALTEGLPPEWNVYDSLNRSSKNGTGYHRGVVHRPEKYADTPILAYARNPWDWYVSFFSFFRGRYGEGDDVAVFRKSLESILADDACTRHTAGMIMDLDMSLACRLRRVEDGVGAQLIAFVDNNCPSLPDKLVEITNTAERKNVSRRGDYRSYYTDDLAMAVAARDSWLISEYDYEFGG